MTTMQYWLMKSEPGDYAIGDLARDKAEWWTGVRNFQARNFMMKMQKGDGVLFYHSSCKVPGVYGVATIGKTAAADQTQFDATSNYYDGAASAEKPRWFCPQLAFVREHKTPWTLAAIRAHPQLAKMIILRRGNRLSVTPVSAGEWKLLSAPPK